MVDVKEIKNLLEEIKKACDEKLKEIEEGNVSEDEMGSWESCFSQALQDISYPDL